MYMTTLLERLPQDLQDMAAALGQFIQEAHAVVGQRDLAGHRDAAATVQPRIREGSWWGARHGVAYLLVAGNIQASAPKPPASYASAGQEPSKKVFKTSVDPSDRIASTPVLPYLTIIILAHLLHHMRLWPGWHPNIGSAIHVMLVRPRRSITY